MHIPRGTTTPLSIPAATISRFNWCTYFNSSSELAAALLRLGKRFDVLQLSTGQLRGHFSIVNLTDLSIFSIQTNQLLLLNGERGQDCISFSLETSGNFDQHRIFCQAIEPFSLHGFKPDLAESHFQLTAGSTSVIAVASAKKFCKFLEHCGQLDLLERLHACNSMQLEPKQYSQISQQLTWCLRHPFHTAAQRSQRTEYIFTLMLEVFTRSQPQSFKTFDIAPRQQLIHELIDWGFKNSTDPIKLDEISNILFCSRRTLIQGCKENFNMGPMELLRLIRLEQVNTCLRSEELRRALHLNKVGDIASHYGFTSRGHFSAAYHNQFSETPRQTLSKSKG